jgi:hypothetical protein
MVTTNGNGGATATPRVIRGASVAHQDLDKRQRACLTAEVLEGAANYQPTRKELAQLLGVSGNYIDAARKLSPERRRAIIEGRDDTSFAALLNPPEPQFALPMPASSIATNGEAIDDNTLFNIVATAGVDRVLTTAVEVERTTMTS